MIKEKVDALTIARENWHRAKDIADSHKAAYDQLQADLLHEMAETGTKTAVDTSGEHTATRVQKPDVRLVDEEKAVSWLRQNVAEPDHYLGLKWANFKPIARTALNTDGEVVPGTEIATTEYISLREVKK